MCDFLTFFEIKEPTCSFGKKNKALKQVLKLVSMMK